MSPARRVALDSPFSINNFYVSPPKRATGDYLYTIHHRDGGGLLPVSTMAFRPEHPLKSNNLRATEPILNPMIKKGLRWHGWYRRCLAVLLRAQGTHPRNFAETPDVTKRSVERRKKAYRTEGVAGLRCKPPPGRAHDRTV